MFHQAFRRLVRDAEVRPGMEIACTLVWLAKERDTIETYETELSRLQSLINANETSGIIWSGLPREMQVLYDRQALLLRELAISQDKCTKWEARKSAALKAKAAWDKAHAAKK